MRPKIPSHAHGALSTALIAWDIWPQMMTCRTTRGRVSIRSKSAIAMQCNASIISVSYQEWWRIDVFAGQSQPTLSTKTPYQTSTAVAFWFYGYGSRAGR